MKKVKTKIISYRSFFSKEEISIIDDYLFTEKGKKENSVVSYIKVNILNFLSFLKENANKYKDIDTCEAVETLKDSFSVFSGNKIQILGLK